MSNAALSALWMSLGLAALTVLLCTPLAVALAWWMARVHWRGKVLLDAIILLPLGLPAALIGFWLLTGLGSRAGQALAWSWTGLYPGGAVLAACIMTTPLMARTLRPVFEAHDPMLLPVARTLGANTWHAWRTVALPLTLPAIGSAMALGFAAAWGESGAVLVLAAGPALGSAPTEAPTVPLALWQALSASARPQALARELAALSLGVAIAAILLSEWLRWQWLHRWRGAARSHWQPARP